MPVDYLPASARSNISKQIGDYVFFDDLLESKTTKDPMVGIWFRIEQGPPVGPGVHAYDESGVVFEGTLTLRDETGNERTLERGDTFFIHRGSTVLFSSTDFAVCYKCAARVKGKL
ncbi:hypothetical protein HBI38_172540 [Parastagonospora nodorum]|nr:hypothetical protein HBH50_177650 [Parastagonospora nodorum]KAH4084257.1 hypothetical protein HBH48_166840 [Parastagonospora nodorum]KAH4402499.1 hypothetical protein HBH92_209180 [Parastagonospora nodorum]KAH4427950.1 hypothetical protein HBH93_163000 [Parastagonospora nodorum]KAH4438058.1 hypothetical protein HBH91_186810 [Parastagonospora nodorum]